MVDFVDKYVSVSGSGGQTGVDAENAWTLAGATAGHTTGERLNVLAGTYTVQDGASGAVMNLQTVGSNSAQVEWRAYTTTIGDFSIGDAPPVILDAGANSLTNAATTGGLAGFYHTLIGFHFTGASSDGFEGTASDFLTFVGCKADNNGGIGIDLDNNCNLEFCEVTNNTTNAVHMDSLAYVIGCTFHNEAVDTGVLRGGSGGFWANRWYDNGNGVNLNLDFASSSMVIGNTFDGDGQAASIGLFTDRAIVGGVFNNIFFDLSVGWDTNNRATGPRGFNLYSTCTADMSDSFSVDGSDISNSVDPFTDSANRDYSLASGSAARSAGIDAQVTDFAIGSVTLTGGGSGSVDGITVNSVEIMSGAVNFNSDLTTTAADVAADINGNFSAPNYIASSSGAVITIEATVSGTGSDGYVVTSSTTTITTTDANMSGGLAKGLDLGALQAIAAGGGSPSGVRNPLRGPIG